MVRRVVWGQSAIDDKFQILHYWDNKNKSKQFSIKLNRLLNNTADLVGKYPFMGKNRCAKYQD